MAEEKERRRTLDPFPEVLRKLASPIRVFDLNSDASVRARRRIVEPLRFGESGAMKPDRQRWRQHLHGMTQTEGRLEPDSAEADRVQLALVGEGEATEGPELLLLEVPAVVLEDEAVVHDRCSGSPSSDVIGVLKQLRQHVARALHLLEQQPPRTGQIFVLLQLIPPVAGLIADRREPLRRAPRARLGRHSGDSSARNVHR